MASLGDNPPMMGSEIAHGKVIATGFHGHDVNDNPQYVVLLAHYSNDERRHFTYSRTRYVVGIVQAQGDKWTSLYWQQFDAIDKAINGEVTPAAWNDKMREEARPWKSGFLDCLERNTD